MRWKTLRKNTPSEWRIRKEGLAKIDRWWKTLSQQTEKIQSLFKQESQWDLPDWMHTHLGAVHPQLMWEFGPAVKGPGLRLVITPENSKQLRPFTRTLIERAPQLEGWEFYEYRFAESLEEAFPTVEGRAGINVREMTVVPQMGDHHRIDLHYYCPAFTTVDPQEALHAAFVFTESLLGEERLDKWIGVIEASPTPRKGLLGLASGKSPEGAISLDRLNDTVESLAGSIRDQLPGSPWMASIEEAKWSLLKLKPKENEDYCQSSDLFVAVTCDPDLWAAMHGPNPFYAKRYSRSGETFYYVKMDRAEFGSSVGFADRSEMEDAINQVLREQQLGCVIGGGSGRRYSYIDLALVDANRGIQAVRDRLRAGGLPKRSWILCHEADLVAEWIGVHDDSPAPPMPNFDAPDES